MTVATGPSHREALPSAPQRPVIDTNLQGVRSHCVLVGQLRKLRSRYIDFLIVCLRYPVEDKVTVAGILERICGDRVAVRIGSREQRGGRNCHKPGIQRHIRSRHNWRAFDRDLRRRSDVGRSVVHGPCGRAQWMTSGRGIGAGILVGDLAQERIIGRN